MTTPARQRLDELLVVRGLAGRQDQARALVASGLVEVNGTRAASGAAAVPADSVLRVLGGRGPWASRAGAKLEGALDDFGISAGGRVCLDAGASTGGFTDVLLQHGATLVHAVDVGRGLLAARLAADPRVCVHDRTNLRTLVPERLGLPLPSLVTLDLSFISLRRVLPALPRLAPAAEVVALFKPQFEVARRLVEPGGVVRDRAAVAAAVSDFTDWITSTGTAVLAPPLPARLRGTKGNQEWLLHLRLPGQSE